jgi:positive regulator of sigma E activity
MKDHGSIISIDEEKIILKLNSREECHKCGACQGTTKQQFTIPFKPEYKGLKTGDSVEVQIDDRVVLKICVLLYGLPLVAFITGIIPVYSITKDPLISFSAALLLTLITYLFVGKYTGSGIVFTPVINNSKSEK